MLIKTPPSLKKMLIVEDISKTVEFLQDLYFYLRSNGSGQSHYLHKAFGDASYKLKIYSNYEAITEEIKRFMHRLITIHQNFFPKPSNTFKIHILSSIQQFRRARAFSREKLVHEFFNF